MDVLLSGVVGSTAYGLAGPDSDIDKLGVYAAPTIEFHGLHPPLDKRATIVSHDPDVTFHEAGKFAAKCLSGNPTMNELLWLNEYEVVTDLGMDLVYLRSKFLSAQRIREAYIGYARAQFKRLLDTGQFASKQRARSAKHARHMLRLLNQGLELYSTGRLTVKLTNPDWYREHGDRIAADPDHARQFLDSAEANFDAVTSSPLPARPDEEAVERWLHRVRARFYRPPA